MNNNKRVLDIETLHDIVSNVLLLRAIPTITLEQHEHVSQQVAFTAQEIFRTITKHTGDYRTEAKEVVETIDIIIDVFKEFNDLYKKTHTKNNLTLIHS